MRYRAVEVDEVLKATDAAFLFEIGGEEKWVPKSCVESPDEIGEGDTGLSVEVAEWFALREGL